jgi:hypothetical protein
MVSLTFLRRASLKTYVPASKDNKPGLVERFRTSRRLQRRAFFGSLAVCVSGIVALSVVVLLPNQSNAFNAPISTVPAATIAKDPVAAVDPASERIARQFLLTAVQRKNLDWAYDNVHIDLKGRMSRKVWDQGNIPVIPYDAANAKTTAFIVQFSLRTEVEFEVALVPKVHSVYASRPLRFYIALRREHDKANGRWLVSYFEPHWKPPILTQ